MCIWKRDIVCLSISGEHRDMRRALHIRYSTVTKESTSWFQVPLDDKPLLWIGKKVSRYGRVVGHLLSQIITTTAIVKFISTSKDLSKHWVVWLLHPLL